MFFSLFGPFQDSRTLDGKSEDRGGGVYNTLCWNGNVGMIRIFFLKAFNEMPDYLFSFSNTNN